jgi:hypothetical protein
MQSTSDRRIATQEATVRGLFNILKALGSERLFSVLPFDFEDKHYKDLKTPHAVDGALNAISYRTGLNALKPLQRLIRGHLEKQAKDQSLAPTVVVVITDGDVRKAKPPTPQQSHPYHADTYLAGLRLDRPRHRLCRRHRQVQVGPAPQRLHRPGSLLPCVPRRQRPERGRGPQKAEPR